MTKIEIKNAVIKPTDCCGGLFSHKEFCLLSNVGGGWILTYTGKKFFPLAPEKADVDIFDIAHALSNICRFTGHCREFYSVAQHSVEVAERVYLQTLDRRAALAGLLHDASEAYLCDIARPVKHSAEFERYRQLEKVLQAVIDEKYGVDSGSSAVKEADEYLLNVEAFHLMPDCAEWSATTTAPDKYETFKCLSPTDSKRYFHGAFLDFGGSQIRQ